jgi:hydroxyacylglutathione hydrolase
MIDPEQTVLLVVESERDVKLATEQLFRLGYDHLAGYLHDDMTSWQNAGLPLQRVGEWTVQELDQHKEDPDVLDDEYQEGAVPGAKHMFIAHLEEHLHELDRSKHIVTYCGSGFRAAIAASLLKKYGFELESSRIACRDNDLKELSSWELSEFRSQEPFQSSSLLTQLSLRFPIGEI